MLQSCFTLFFFFFNDTATTEIYTLSLHDALPIWDWSSSSAKPPRRSDHRGERRERGNRDRKSTRLNSSHITISYAVFCLKKKKQIKHRPRDDQVDPARVGYGREPANCKARLAAAL